MPEEPPVPLVPEVPDVPEDPPEPEVPDEPEDPLVPDDPDVPLVPSPPVAPSKFVVQALYVPEPSTSTTFITKSPVPKLYDTTSPWKWLEIS